MGNAKFTDHFVGRIVEEIFAHVGHLASWFGGDQSGDRPQGSTLAGPIGPDDAHNLPFVNLEADAVKGPDPPIGNP